MKKFQFILTFVAAALTAAAFTACNNEPEPTPAPAPSVTLSEGVASATSLTATITSKSADEVKWACVEKGETMTAEAVLKSGKSVAANSTQTIEIENLNPETEYTIYAAAKSAAHSSVAFKELTMKTLKGEESAAMTVKLTAGERGSNSLTFTVTTTNATQVKWMMAMPGMEVTAADVLANGIEIEANKQVSIVAEELMSDFEYMFYAAATNGEKELLSEGLTMRTLPGEDPGEEGDYFSMEAARVVTEVAEGASIDKYRITFSDEAQDMTLALNVCTTHAYLPEGLFAFGEEEAANTILFTDSYFAVEGANLPIVGGEVVFSAPESADGDFMIEGIVELEDDGLLEFFYEGSLGLPTVPAGPENVQMTLGKGSAKAGDNPGEWILTFYDDFMNRVELYCVSPVKDEYPNYLPDGNYWLCSPEENYSSSTYGWINTERSYIQYGGEEHKLLPRDLSIGRNSSIKFDTNYDELRDSNTLSTNSAIHAEDGLYTFELSFAGPLYGDGSKIETSRTLDSFTQLTEYSTSPDGTKLLLRLVSYYGDLYFCLNLNEEKKDVSGSVSLTKDENGEWVFPEWESFEFDVAEMDLSRSYLFEAALGNGNASIYYLTAGKIRISRADATTFNFLAVDLQAEMTGSNQTILVNFTQNNAEKGWAATLNDSEEWEYNWGSSTPEL